MIPTIKDVAQRAGVSTATVSRVVNHDPRISSATRERVQKVIGELNYKVNTVARSLKNKATRTIGLITPEIANIFFMRIAEGVEDQLGLAGYSMIVVNSRESVEGEQRTLELLIEKQVDGAIVIPASSGGRHLRRLQEAGVPVVLVDRMVEGLEADAVLVDNFEATQRTIADLIRAGHTDFGFIGGDPDLTTARERYKGFTDALERAGLSLNPEHVRHGDFHESSGYRLFGELMNLRPPPSTIMIANYFMQIGALRYAAAHRDTLPRDLFLVSFDNPELAAVTGIPGVSIEQPIATIGRRAAEVLLERIDEPSPRPCRVERLQTQLVPTGGSG